MVLCAARPKVGFRLRGFAKRNSMSKKFEIVARMALAAALFHVVGCSALSTLLGGDKQADVDPNVLATYFDGAEVRPGNA